MLRARLGWTRRSHGDISTRAHAIYDGTKKNVRSFPKPPVDLEDLKAQLDRFDGARAGSLDRSRKAFAELKSARKILTHSLDQLGHYVEAASKDDVATFISSGFELAGGGRASQDGCPVPRLLWLKAGHYELRWGAQSPNGGPPETWKSKKYTGQTASPCRRAGSSHDLRLSSARLWKQRRIYGLEQLPLAHVHINHTEISNLLARVLGAHCQRP
jgi:hypothetical protein